MTRYCVEFDADSRKTIIHDQHCSSYTHGSLLAQGRVADLGEFKCASAALDSIRRSRPETILCFVCCAGQSVRGQAAADKAAPEAPWPSGLSAG